MTPRHAKRPSFMKHFRFAIKLLGYVCVTYIVVLSIISVSIRVLGFEPYLVVSNSMQPVFSKGDMVLVSKKPLSYNKGDILAFKSTWYNNQLVVHRYHDKTLDGIITKGDNNPVVDPRPLEEKNIVGQVVSWSTVGGAMFSYYTIGVVCGLAIVGFTFGTNKRVRRKH